MLGISWRTFFFIMFAINLTGLLIILVMNGVTVMYEGGSPQSIQRFAHNSGLLFIKSQGVISDAVMDIKENPDIDYGDLIANQRFIIGGSALTILMIMVVFSILGKVLKRTRKSSWYTIGLIILSIFIIMILQIVVGYLVLGEFLWPYNGFFDMATNPGVVWRTFTTPAPGMITNMTTVIT